MVYVIFKVNIEMEPLLTLDGIQRRTRSLPWTQCLLGFLLTLEFATFVLVLTLLLNISPAVPDIVKVTTLATRILNDANIVLPKVNATMYAVEHLLPDLERALYYAEAICKHTSGCPEYKF